ncbi:MAG: GNAT family N-acetyltransferase [Moorea sp. SIO4A3]|nr:GNAT family N-acetyltransferase [Moorena sp. SIO4A3]
MSENIIYRSSNMEDLSKILTLKKNLYEEGYASVPDAQEAIDFVADLYKQYYEEGNCIHYLGQSNNGDIVACAGAFSTKMVHIPHLVGLISDVYTMPEYRGQGLATTLVQSCLDWLKERVNVVYIYPNQSSRYIFDKLEFKSSALMYRIL